MSLLSGVFMGEWRLGRCYLLPAFRKGKDAAGKSARVSQMPCSGLCKRVASGTVSILLRYSVERLTVRVRIHFHLTNLAKTGNVIFRENTASTYLKSHWGSRDAVRPCLCISSFFSFFTLHFSFFSVAALKKMHVCPAATHHSYCLFYLHIASQQHK